jgi:hypothetical protein
LPIPNGKTFRRTPASREISRRATALATFVVIAALAGCGESTTTDSGVAGRARSSPATQTGTRTQLAAGATTTTPATAKPGSARPARSEASLDAIARADAICARRNSELAAVGDDGASLSEIAAASARRASIERGALDELRKLSPPARVAQYYRRVLEYSQAALQQVVKLAAYARSGDTKGVESAKQAAGARQLRVLVAASRAGVKHCYLVG